MIKLEVHVTGSYKADRALGASVPKDFIIENKLDRKKFLLVEFKKGRKGFIDVVPLSETNYKRYNWFRIPIPKTESRNIGIQVKDKISLTILDAKSEDEAKISNPLIEDYQNKISSLEFFPPIIKTHQTYRKLENPTPLWFEYKDKYLFWWNSGARLHPLILPKTLQLDTKLATLAGGLRGEVGSSDCVTTGEFSNASPEFINFVLDQIDEKLEIKKEQWKGRIEYRGPEWNSETERRLKEFWSYTTGIKNFYKSRFTKVTGKKSMPCGELMIHTGGILLKEALNGLVNSIESKIANEPEILPNYIVGLLSAEGSLHVSDNSLRGISIFTKSSRLAKFYQTILSFIGIDTGIFKNRSCNVLYISGWSNFLRLYELVSRTNLTPFIFSLPYRDILFFQGFSNLYATNILLVWDENLDNTRVKTTEIKNKIEEEFGRSFDKRGIGVNLTNLHKEGLLEGGCKRGEYQFKLTEKGNRSKNALSNLSFMIKNSWEKMKKFNSLLQKFELGKIEINDNMRIETTWSND